MMIPMRSELEKNKAFLYEARNNLEDKRGRIESLDLKIMNTMTDRDSIRMDNNLIVKQRNIYCNITKRMYGKLTPPYHSLDICKEQHRKLLPFISFE